MHCTIRHYPSQALSLLINRNPPRCFSYKNCFITSAVSKIKGKKSKALSNSLVGCMKTSPTSSGELWKPPGDRVNIPCCWFAHFSWGFSLLPCLLFLLGFHRRGDFDRLQIWNALI